MQVLPPQVCRWGLVLALVVIRVTDTVAAEPGPPPPDAVAAENQALRERVEVLEDQLRALAAQVAALQQAQAAGPSRGDAWTADPPEPVPRGDFPPPAPAPGSLGPRVVLSGEWAFAYFDGGGESAFPHGQFRVDDSKLFIDAEVRRGIYAFVEIDVALRESEDTFELGEIYLEWEDFGRTWGLPSSPTLRIGRLDVPVGEEYQVRDPLANPLISHSLADFWGVDEGVELFGGAARWTYVVAVQNGSRPTFGDFTSDKAVTLRVGYEAAPGLRLGVSAMRTGDIDAQEERLTELWWGGGFLRSIGGPATRYFSGQLFQVDASYAWTGGGVRLAGGVVRYRDDDPAADNRRHMRHLMIEARQDLGRDWYAAGRYSMIDAAEGYPLAGQGDFGTYFFGRSTEEAWRFSLGVGYRWTPDLLFKFEYSWEGGTLEGGADREDMNQLATQAAVRF